jgi:hypothetical protein
MESRLSQFIHAGIEACLQPVSRNSVAGTGEEGSKKSKADLKELSDGAYFSGR